VLCLHAIGERSTHLCTQYMILFLRKLVKSFWLLSSAPYGDIGAMKIEWVGSEVQHNIGFYMESFHL